MNNLEQIYNDGLRAGAALKDEDDCPHERETPEWRAWISGYEDAARLAYDGMR